MIQYSHHKSRTRNAIGGILKTGLAPDANLRSEAKIINFSMLDMIITLAEAFRAQQKQLYMVGGTVRDVLLHRGQSADADLATDARPDEIKRLVAPTNPTAVVLVGERFGTVRLHYGANIIE